MNPNKSFKVFDATSDVDVAIVSGFHFQTAWRYLRNNGHIRYRLGGKQKAAWDDHVNRLIFWGAVATDKLLPLMPFATPWLKAAAEASSAAAIADREVKFRIYADYESLRAYQIRSIKTARDLALTGSN